MQTLDLSIKSWITKRSTIYENYEIQQSITIYQPSIKMLKLVGLLATLGNEL